MGYYEIYCQICGVSFAIARNRRADEPHSAAWDYRGSAHAITYYIDDEDCRAGTDSGCKTLDDGIYGLQHLVGPGCVSINGYSGYRISVEEMQGSRAVQVLAKKEENWQPEADDEMFEVESQFFLTGLGDGSPDSTALEGIRPTRHGISSISIENVSARNISSIHSFSDSGLPFHPTCFQIFKKVSLLRLGNVNVQGLWDWRDRDWSFETMYDEFKGEMPRTRAVMHGREQWWCHEPGCEYLAANPINIPGLPALLKSSQSRFGRHSTSTVSEFKDSPRDENSESYTGSTDPFRSVPMEVTSMVLEYLSSKDIASLRLATRAFRQVPHLQFRRLLLEDMPWMWEVEEIVGKNIYWHRLYCAIKFEWAGLKGLQNRKRIWHDAEEIVRRIGQYRAT